MNKTGIEYIQRSLRNNMEDLHIMFTHDFVNIDTEFLNAVNMALLIAETAIQKATEEHDQRIAEHEKNFPSNNK